MFKKWSWPTVDLSVLISRSSGSELPSPASTRSGMLPSRSLPNRAVIERSILLTVQSSIADRQPEHLLKPASSCAPGRIRTSDLRFREPMLYPLSSGSEGITAVSRSGDVVFESGASSYPGERVAMIIPGIPRMAYIEPAGRQQRKKRRKSHENALPSVQAHP